MRTPTKTQDLMPRLLEVPETHCRKCGACLYASNNVRRRPLQTLQGKWMLVMKDKLCTREGCALRGVLIRPPEESTLPILARKSYGLDVVAWIGRERAVGRRSLPEAYASLRKEFGIDISERQVSYLFQVFGALAHCIYADEGPLRQKLIEQGRICLAIDAVFFDATSPGLFVVRDTISTRILYAERAPTRDVEHLRPLLRKVNDIGVPIIGVVSDREKAQVLAVEQELPGVPYQYCQTHFLKNLVKQMEDDLGVLTAAVTETAAQLRKLEKALPEQARILRSPESELKLVTKLCKAARLANRASGDPIVDPTGLKRAERMGAVAKTAEKAGRKADPKATALVVGDAEEALSPEGGSATPTVASEASPQVNECTSPAPNAEAVAPEVKTGRRSKHKGVCPLLLSVLGTLVELRSHRALALRLRRQVDVVRKVAHILQIRTSGSQVKRILSTYLNQLLKLDAVQKPGDAFGNFILHLDALVDRNWAGLFHCYDVPGLPANNNDLERLFGAIKRAERKATGRKSTAGGPLETCAEFMLESWDAVTGLPDLIELLKEVTDAQLRKALEEMEKFSEAAREKRQIQRDPDGYLSEALEAWFNA